MSMEFALLLGGVGVALALSKRNTPPAAPAAAAEPSGDPSSTWSKYDLQFKAVASLYRYPWTWLKAIALCESTLGTDPFYLANAQGSRDGKSWGLLQLTLPTATDMAGIEVTPDDLRDDGFSIEMAGKYVDWLYERYGGDSRKTIMSYNQGPGNTDKGRTNAAEYFDRWQRWLTKVESGKPYL